MVGIDPCITYTLLPFSCQVIDLLLLNANSAIVQLYHGEIKLIVNEMKMRFDLIWTSLIWLLLPFLRRNRRGIVLINTTQVIWYLKLLTLNLWCNCTFEVWLIYWLRCHVIIWTFKSRANEFHCTLEYRIFNELLFASIFLFIVWINAHVKYFKNIEHEWDEERRSTKHQTWTHVLKKSRQFQFLIRHQQCYSYIQSSSVSVLAVIVMTNVHVL
jgi:hypothetical protein